MKKKLVAMCMAAMMALGATAPAYAANTSDTEYEFYITATYQRTAARKKTDTTKVYTCYDQGPAQLAFQAWASNGGSSTGTNATTGDEKTAYVRRGVQSSITNKVKEWGYSSTEFDMIMEKHLRSKSGIKQSGFQERLRDRFRRR